MTEVAEVIALLNSLQVGEVGKVDTELRRAFDALSRAGHAELAERVAEARVSLHRGQLKDYRKAIANVTARLGHLR